MVKAKKVRTIKEPVKKSKKSKEIKRAVDKLKTGDKTLHLKKGAFLEAYITCGMITKSAKAAGVSRKTHYEWMKLDDNYNKAFKEAERIAADMLEEEAVRRARDGVVQGIYHQGKEVATKLVYSDLLLMFLLKGNKPSKFKDRVETSQEEPIKIEVEIVK